MRWVQIKDEIAAALNRLAREQFKLRLYLDVMADMAVCDIEGWDKLQYLQELKTIIDHFIVEELADG